MTFSKLLNQKASHKPSAQHVLDEDYYKRIEAIQFTMSHDDGKKTEDIIKSDIILLGVSRTGKTPTSIYLANRGFKTMNIPLVEKQNIPENIKTKNFKSCVIGLYADPQRLSDIRRNRVNIMRGSGRIQDIIPEARYPIYHMLLKSIQVSQFSKDINIM